MSNVEEIAFLVCKDLGVKVSLNNLSKHLREHPYFPSLLAVHDEFKAIGIDTLTLKTNDTQQVKQHTALVQIKAEDGGHLFAYIYAQTDESLDWFNPEKQKREVISHDEFKKAFTGYIMLFDVQESAGEKNYKQVRRRDIRQGIINYSLIMILPLLLVIVSAIAIIKGNSMWACYVYGLFLLIGSIIGGLLLVHEYNEYNPVLSNICGRSEKTNCSAVLHSKGAQLWGFPWSISGTAYFVGSLSSLLVSSFDVQVFITLAFIHLMAVPYVAYSLYYQYSVVRQWCPLCLAVQAVILALFITALIGGSYSCGEHITTEAVITITVSMFLSAAWIYFVWKYSMQKRESKYHEQTLRHIKYNPDVFHALLKAGKSIDIPSDDCGITIGNPLGSIHIIKVCNPYCGHCAAAQPVLHELLESNNDIRLQMIFTVSPDSLHYKDYPIDTFLSLYDEGVEMEPILAEWYNDKDKSMEAFNKKHPVKNRFTQVNHANAEAMHRFCEEADIRGTPTIFINGYMMPELYRVSDLKFFY